MKHIFIEETGAMLQDVLEFDVTKKGSLLTEAVDKPKITIISKFVGALVDNNKKYGKAWKEFTKKHPETKDIYDDPKAGDPSYKDFTKMVKTHDQNERNVIKNIRSVVDEIKKMMAFSDDTLIEKTLSLVDSGKFSYHKWADSALKDGQLSQKDADDFKTIIIEMMRSTPEERAKKVRAEYEDMHSEKTWFELKLVSAYPSRSGFVEVTGFASGPGLANMMVLGEMNSKKIPANIEDLVAKKAKVKVQLYFSAGSPLISKMKA